MERGVQEIINTTDRLPRAFLSVTTIVFIMINDDRQALATFDSLKTVAPAPSAITPIPKRDLKGFRLNQMVK
jgi:hypothetical protein